MHQLSCGEIWGGTRNCIDLATESGVELVKGTWRYSDVRIIETDFFEAGP
jgi:hypothetical protein